MVEIKNETETAAVKLDAEKIDALRSQLRNILGRGEASQVFASLKAPVDSHSSHTDNDGWI